MRVKDPAVTERNYEAAGSARVRTDQNLRSGEAVMVGKQVTLNILLSFQGNNSFHLSSTAQTRVLSCQRFLTDILENALVVGA
jgi:hypothetical protein